MQPETLTLKSENIIQDDKESFLCELITSLLI